MTLDSIGFIYARLGQDQTALDYYEQALTIAHEVDDRISEGRTLSNIGAVYNDLRQYQTALDYYEQALTIHQALGEQRGEGAHGGS